MEAVSSVASVKDVEPGKFEIDSGVTDKPVSVLPDEVDSGVTKSGVEEFEFSGSKVDEGANVGTCSLRVSDVGM